MRGFVFCLLLVGCAAAQPHTPKLLAPVLRALHYTVAVDPRLEQLTVALCFEGQPPAQLVYGTKQASQFLRAVHVLADGRALPVEHGRIALPKLAADSCIVYGVDLRQALAFDALMLAYPGDGALLFSTDLFLWRPEQRSPQLQSQVRFELPEGVRVSTPWPLPPAPDTYALDERAFAFTGHIVLGRFATRTLAAPAAELQLTIMPGFTSDQYAVFADWITRSAAVASAPAHAFPVTRAQVIIAPSSPSPYPIHFGHTGRSGGASMVLFVPTDITADALRADWIAIHEFSHLWHPFIRREDAWLSEGLATYLQEVLRARAGLVTPSSVWQRLYEGAQLGRETAHTLADETRRMAFEHNYRRVYWAGAAIALLLDVQLRRDGLSLDVLLARLHARPELFMRMLSAHELLRVLDELAAAELSQPVCEALASRYLTAGLPDLTALYAELGIDPATGEPSANGGPLAHVRDAILAETPRDQNTHIP